MPRKPRKPRKLPLLLQRKSDPVCPLSEKRLKANAPVDFLVLLALAEIYVPGKHLSLEGNKQDRNNYRSVLVSALMETFHLTKEDRLRIFYRN
jgi:hypothetical protein